MIQKSDVVCFFNKHGVLHRLDGPAVEHSDGQVYYYVDGIHFVSLEEFQEHVNNRTVQQILDS